MTQERKMGTKLKCRFPGKSSSRISPAGNASEGKLACRTDPSLSPREAVMTALKQIMIVVTVRSMLATLATENTSGERSDKYD